MFSLKSLIIAGVLMAGIVAPLGIAGSASAATTCTIEDHQPNIGRPIQEGRKFTREGNRAYIKFTLKGGKNCIRTVTLLSWKAPNGTDGKPYREQTMYRRQVADFKGPGEHRMSIQLPNCYFQVDLVRGTVGPNADAAMGYDRIIASAHGGNKVCAHVPDTPEEPEVPETPTTPTTPATPATPTTPASNTTATLTKTGPGAIIAAIFTGMTTLGTAAHYFVRRKLLNA